MNVILPLNFPQAPEVAALEDEVDVSLRDLRHWDLAPENPAKLDGAGVEFVLTAADLKDAGSFLAQVRTAIERGLDSETALAALTTRPAGWLSMADRLGTVEKGKMANLIVASGDIFAKETVIHDVLVGGRRFEITAAPAADVRGSWNLTLGREGESRTGELKLTGTASKPVAEFEISGKKIKAKAFTLSERLVTVSFQGDSLNQDGLVRLSGMVTDKTMQGRGSWPDGKPMNWTAQFKAPPEEKNPESKSTAAGLSTLQPVFPEGAYGVNAAPEQPAVIFVKNATIWTSGPQGRIDRGNLLIKNGKVSAVGTDLSAPGNALVIDAAGKHVTPGIIDAHSHTASSDPFVNELTFSITSEVRMEDVINSEDIGIYRQLAGGVTSVQLLHGSGNSIGGQSAILKFRWGATPEEMKFRGAFPSIKFALGENVKRSSVNNDNRFPKTRMGVEQFFTSWFQAAKDYQTAWENYRSNGRKNKDLMPPRRNLRLDALVEILADQRIIHCHSYRQDEILALMRVAEAEGFRVFTFTHILEGYKVADEMQKHGAMASTFSDWWAYKFEVYDAIPYNGALMNSQGVVVSFNSDSGELARRLNTEAAKAVKYGGVAETDALEFVTLNPAKQLRISHRVGSLEPGKDADFVIWSGNPLSTYSICEQTWIDGRKYFDLETDRELREKAEKERIALVQKSLKSGSDPSASGKKTAPSY